MEGIARTDAREVGRADDGRPDAEDGRDLAEMGRGGRPPELTRTRVASRGVETSTRGDAPPAVSGTEPALDNATGWWGSGGRPNRLGMLCPRLPASSGKKPCFSKAFLRDGESGSALCERRQDRNLPPLLPFRGASG